MSRSKMEQDRHSGIYIKKVRVKKAALLDNEKVFHVLKMHAEFKSFKEIAVEAKELWGETDYFATVIGVERTIKDGTNKLTLDKMRNNYLAKLKNIAISHKRVRLDDLESLRQTYIEHIKANGCVDEKERSEFRFMAKGLTDILNAARNELEGNGITFNQLNVIGEWDDKSDDDLRARRDELIRKAERALIGRASGDSGDPEGVIETTAEQPA